MNDCFDASLNEKTEYLPNLSIALTDNIIHPHAFVKPKQPYHCPCWCIFIYILWIELNCSIRHLFDWNIGIPIFWTPPILRVAIITSCVSLINCLWVFLATSLILPSAIRLMFPHGPCIIFFRYVRKNFVHFWIWKLYRNNII